MNGLSAAEILTTTSTAGLTREQQLQLVQQIANDGANYKNVASLEALAVAEGLVTTASGEMAAAEGAATTSTTGLGLAAKGAGSKLKNLASGLTKTHIIVAAVIAAVVALGAAIYLEVTKAKRAQEKIDDLNREFEDSKSELESLESQLESVGKQIDEINNKDNITITDSEQLQLLKEESAELERQIKLQETKSKADLNNAVGEYRDNIVSLTKDFDRIMNRYTDKQQELASEEAYADSTMKSIEELNQLLEDGTISAEEYEKRLKKLGTTQENIAETLAQENDELINIEGELLDKVADFEAERKLLLQKYNNDISAMSEADKDLLDKTNTMLQSAYQLLYDDDEYFKLYIEPIFSSDELSGLRDDITSYFINNGTLDTQALTEAFGEDIISALQEACELAGVPFDSMIQALFNRANAITTMFAPHTESINSARDVEQNRNSDDKINYFYSLDSETQNRIIELGAEIPDTVKFGTLKDFQEWINGIQEEAVIEIQADITDFLSKNQELKNRLIQLAETGKLDTDAIKSWDEYDDMLQMCGDDADKLINTLETLAKQATTTFDSINNLTTLNTGFKSLADVYEDRLDGDDYVAPDLLSGLYDQFGNLSVFDDFMSKMQDMKATTEEVQAAFDDLATAYIDTEHPLSDLTNQNIEYTIKALETMGVTNAQTAAEERLRIAEQIRSNALDAIISSQNALNLAKQYGINTTNDLANATAAEIQQLLNETSASGGDTTALRQLLLSKQGVNSATIQAEHDVNNLLLMAKIAGVTSASYKMLEETKKAPGTPSAVINQLASNLKVEMQKAINGFNLSLPKYTYNGNASTYKSSSSGTPSSSSSTEDKEPDIETFDWIEVAIKRIQEAYARLEKVSGNVYKLWKTRNQAVNDQLVKTREEIDLQQKAYDGYMAKANSIGLSAEYVSKVQNGTIQIEDIADEDLRNKISGYQEWYEKAIACKDAIQDLNIQLSDLYKQKFDNIKSEFDSYIGYVQSQADLIDERINRTETQGYFVSKNYYDQLIQFENDELNKLYEEYNNLKQARDEALNSGSIEKDSEAWNEMRDEIISVEKAIEESTSALVEYNNAIRDLDWEIFDYIRDRIQQINQEADFLIDLLDNSSLFEDDGRFNSSGKAAIGLHGVNYNTYMDQANEYAKELKKIEKDLAKDPNNKTLIERREELLKLQQESIKSAEAEKEAIKDLVSQGIEIHLNVLSELIEKYKDAINQAKDLYSYQKGLSEQTQNISNLEKILAAYQGDDSEESRKIIQETQNKLKDAQEQLRETEWDRYISETESLLDDMYDDYSEVLNTRLDDIDLLISDMIQMVNQSSVDIQSAISTTADKVGYDVTDSLNTIFNNGGTLITTFNQDFRTYATNTQTALNEIKNSIQTMMTNNALSSNGELSPIGANGSSTPNSNSDGGNNRVSGFVTDLYRSVLGRDPDKSGFEYWTDSIASGKNSFADVARGFLNSPEFQNKKLSNGDFVTVLYRALLGRNPDSVGYSQWLEALNNGTSRSQIIDGFLRSAEFKKLNSYATGSKYISNPELAWTNENGNSELIRRSDGAILTPLGKGSMVFNNEASQRLWELANSNITPGSYVLPQPNIPSNNVSNDVSLEFNFEGDIVANNPEEFAASMRRAIADNSKVQNAIQAITVDLGLGKNSLSVKKYR